MIEYGYEMQLLSTLIENLAMALKSKEELWIHTMVFLHLRRIEPNWSIYLQQVFVMQVVSSGPNCQ